MSFFRRKKHDVTSVKDVVQSGLCASCGTCIVASGSDSSNMRIDARWGHYFPDTSVVKGENAFAVCPGKGCELIRLTQERMGEGVVWDPLLGPIHQVCAARSTDPSVLSSASSGGIMTEIPLHFLASGRANGVIATRMNYTEAGPRPETIIARTREELLGCQGSKYLPVPVNAILNKVVDDDRLLYIGTSCQIHGLRMLQSIDTRFAETISCVVGTFCGGFRSFLEVNTLLRRHGLTLSDITKFRFRGGGQPGSLRAEDKHGHVLERPYPDYTKDTGYKKPRRCRLCIDGTSELSDFSCGDAWIDRFLEEGGQWSLLITRTPEASAILGEMVEQGRLEVKPVSLDEVKRSQRSNLTSKKVRQAARRKACRFLGITVPKFDGGYNEHRTSIILEMKIMSAYGALRLLEKMGLYPIFRRLIIWISRKLRSRKLPE